MKRLKALLLAVIFLFGCFSVGACAPALNEITTAKFESVTVEWNGQQKSITVTGLPEGVTVEYTNNVGTEVGTYDATAVLSGEGYQTKTLTATLTITKAQFKGVSLNDKTVTYDGKSKGLVIEGALPAGTLISYSYGGQSVASVTEVGEYDVVATLKRENYEDKQLTAKLTIAKALFSNELTFESKTVMHEEGERYSIELGGKETLPDDVTYAYTYNGESVDYVTEPGVYEVKLIISNAHYEQTFNATLTVACLNLDEKFISTDDVMKKYTLNSGQFYASADYETDEGVVINSQEERQRSYGIGSNTGMLTTGVNSVTCRGTASAIQKGVKASEYYVEAEFDSTKEYFSLGNGIAGLLVGHGSKSIHSTPSYETMKLIVGIYKDQIVSCATNAWGVNGSTKNNAQETIIQNNWKQNFTASELSAMDMTKIRLGVLRHGGTYSFFINDRYCGGNISKGSTYKFGECAIGIVSIPRYSGGNNLNLTNGGAPINNFRYSTDAQLIDELSAKIPGKSIDLYLIAGQSNASGNARFDSTTMKSLDNQAMEGINKVLFRGAMSNYDFTLTRAGQGESTSTTGVEVGMMNYFKTAQTTNGHLIERAYDVSSGRYAGIIKRAVGGTGFDRAEDWIRQAGWWASPSWIASQNYAPVTNGIYLYDLLVSDTINAVKELKASGFTDIKIKGLFWMQGERNRGWAGENGLYAKAFKSFVMDLRVDFMLEITPITGQDFKTFDVLIGEIAETFDNAQPDTIAFNRKFIATQQYLARTMEGVDILDTQDFPLNKLSQTGTNVPLGSDNYHWNQTDIFNIGKLVAERMMTY